MSKGEYDRSFGAVLKAGVAVLPLAMAFVALPAAAQTPAAAGTSQEAPGENVDAASQDDVQSAEASGGALAEKGNEEIVVTGTSIRGVAPTGTNLITVTQQDIKTSGATSASQVLATVPQIGGNFFNGLPQTEQLNATAVGSQAQMVNRPTLRPSPNSSLDSGNSTLVLIDGNRTSGVGVNSNTASPDAVPPALLERVELNTDGASAVYGSDAISGVINYVTRRRFDGAQASARYGFTDDYKTYDANAILGKDWGSGSAFVSYSYAYADRVYYRDRDYYLPIDFSTGYERDLTCDTPNVRIAAAPGNPLHYYAATAGGVSTAPFTVVAPLVGTPNVCRLSSDATLAAGFKRHNALASVAQDFGDVKLTLRGRYTENQQIANRAAGTYSLVVNNTNPYWRPLTGTADAAATSYTVLGNFRSALGLDPFEYRSKARQYGLTGEISWDIGSNWQFRGVAVYDKSDSFLANPVLTAATQTNGSNASAATPCSVLRTTAACLNPFDIGASDPALLANLLTSEQVGEGHDQIWDFKGTLDGSLFTLPGGDVRVAIGAEYFRDSFRRGNFTGLRANRDNPATAAIPGLVLASVSQTDVSGFVEANIPVVSSLNAKPLLRELRLSASGRYDHYTRFGGTFNPRLGASYKPFDWMRIRGNWNTSFRAPTTVDLLGMGFANSSVSTFAATQVGGSGQLFVDPARPIPVSMGGPTSATARAIVLQGTDPNLKPQEGKGWSAAVELTPVKGLFASVSYYHTFYSNSFGQPCLSTACFPFYPEYAHLFPTQAEYDAFKQKGVGGTAITTLLSDVYGLFDVRKTNLGNTVIEGLDYSVRYTHETGFGSVFGSISGNIQLTNKTQVSSVAPFVSNIDAAHGPQSLHKMTVQLGASSGGFRLTGTLFHSDGYDVIRSATILQDHVSSFNVVNLFASYDFPGGGIQKDLQVTLSVNNLFDSDPPIFRQTGSVGYANGGTLGRVIQFGIQKKFF